ncbi:hypothetical protein ACFTQ7_24385 [Lysinibacillus sp. NPDC056959]
MKDELVDVITYALLFANETGIDLMSAVQQKLQARFSERRYLFMR